ncbi:antibiotic biosynthesis monooxygenase family protein [Nocardioides pocheonensis]|uniref:Antibiotic biosynthesis monooxygenase n=1 Tax=Nocardioides pocheonensis TaxID=661485 RepID=A0A3N0GNF4_9ACTN|nr:antibiotic biosynthesis monooxygenase [Nocardioides pocheonensis]RNM14003.1 antibiotic biosynthesis monooxygenase [Nocardioides pocheonensis]
MDAFATPPEPPYTAVIFTSTRTDGDHGYAAMAARMEELAREQPGYLGFESVREGASGITVSYWVDDAAAAAWKQVHEHLVAQERGRTTWYADYRVQVATVTRSYGPAPRSVTSDTGELPPADD